MPHLKRMESISSIMDRVATRISSQHQQDPGGSVLLLTTCKNIKLHSIPTIFPDFNFHRNQQQIYSELSTAPIFID